jgi:AcrR family transcriptional regulator
MPSETFFKLNEEKRKRVYRCVFEEYTRVPLEEVSVKNIVIAAGIPRGSFYQYFIDKEEALKYLISETTEQDKPNIVRSSGGEELDIYQLVRFVFTNEIEKIKKKESSARVMLLNQIVKSARATSVFYSVIAQTLFNHPALARCWDNMALPARSDDLKKSIFDLLFSTLKDCLRIAIENESKIDASISEFDLKIEIVRIGVAGLVTQDRL